MCKRRVKYSELLGMYEDVVEVNEDLRLTNKTLKDYIKHLKLKNEKLIVSFFSIRTTGCPACTGRSNWKTFIDGQWVTINYCPSCGRIVEQNKTYRKE